MEIPQCHLLDNALHSRNLQKSREIYHDLTTKNPSAIDVIKTRLELQIRTQAVKLGKNDMTSINEVENLLDFTFSLAKEDLCGKSLTVSILQDIFDLSSKRKCEEFFAVVEKSIVEWKTPLFFDTCKNTILRMCNDLLKRLSQTVDTTFCGRILILLAKALPLTERSGLNLMSQVNSSNVTTYDQDVEVKQEGAEEEDVDMEMGEIKDQRDLQIDYKLYVKFWKLQDFFVNPTMIYNHENWLVFENNLADVLSVFTSNKLDRPQDEDSSNRKIKTLQQNGDSTPNGVLNGINGDESISNNKDRELESFSAKYLTSQKLFHLQIADSQFRRYFLTQCLIFTNYLSNTNVKSRDPTLFLSSTQEKTISDWIDRFYQLLKETYPNGSKFADSIKTMLKIDKVWSNWKNEACPDYVSSVLASANEKLLGYRRKKIDFYDPEKIDLGNAELSRLWNIEKDNKKACMSENRVFNNLLETMLDDVLDEVDPAQQVEEQYMKITDEKYQWICSRFLLYNHYEHYTMPKVSLNSETKTELVPLPYQLRNALISEAKVMENYREKALQIEERISQEQKKAAEIEVKSKAEAKAKADAKIKAEFESKAAEERTKPSDETKAKAIETKSPQKRKLSDSKSTTKQKSISSDTNIAKSRSSTSVDEKTRTSDEVLKVLIKKSTVTNSIKSKPSSNSESKTLSKAKVVTESKTPTKTKATVNESREEPPSKKHKHEKDKSDKSAKKEKDKEKTKEKEREKRKVHEVVKMERARSISKNRNAEHVRSESKSGKEVKAERGRSPSRSKKEGRSSSSKHRSHSKK